MNKYLTESEDSQEKLEILSSALEDIADIVENKQCNIQNWNNIKRIIQDVDLEIGY